MFRSEISRKRSSRSACENVIHVGSPTPITLNEIGALLDVDGQEGAGDVLIVDDTGDTAANTGTLTPVTITGLGLSPAGISYQNFADLNIGLGSGGEGVHRI